MTRPDEHTITFGGEVIRFQISRTARRKTVAISVGYDGVRVLAPADVDDAYILAVVRRKAPWVLRKQAGYRELGGVPMVREFVSGETFHYLGRPYRLKVVPDCTTNVTRIVARGAHLLAPAPVGLSPLLQRTSVRSGLKLWYTGRAKALFPVRLKAIADQLGIRAPDLHIVDQSKRWGSCDSHGRIRLNWRLVMAPVSLVDYVIAHEACHTLEHNHSPRFWRALETIMPDYRQRVHRLDHDGHLFVV